MISLTDTEIVSHNFSGNGNFYEKKKIFKNEDDVIFAGV